MVADLALNPDPLLLAKYRSESTISKGGTELSVNDNVVSCLLKEREKKSYRKIGTLILIRIHYFRRWIRKKKKNATTVGVALSKPWP